MASRACGICWEQMFACALRFPDVFVAPANLVGRSRHPNGWLRAEAAAGVARACQHLAPARRDRLTPTVPCTDSDGFRDVSDGRLTATVRAR